MSREITIKAFLDLSSEIPVVDVRAPSEFMHAHIPGAINVPLFSDEERAVVGTIYKKKGQKEAILEGMDIAGKKIKSLAETGIKKSKNGKLLVHCWRGGMRSEAMSWFFEKTGLECYVLKGGYKSYRNFISDYFSGRFKFCILGGMTGSGKTSVLHELEKRGQQVIDLEKIAHHKGSVFGLLGEAAQPSNEQFENEIFHSLYSMNKAEIIWIEDESRNIGRNIIPGDIFKRMSKSPLVILEVPRGLRIEMLVKEYGKFPDEDLTVCLNIISRRLGGLNTKLSIDALLEGKPEKTADILLTYYDKTYLYNNVRSKRKKINVITSIIDPVENANLILEAIELNGIYK